MATFLQTINRVLTDLREGDNLVDVSATELTDEYHLFIASVVNNMLEEVESAHEWWALHQSGTETYTASADSETIDVISGLTHDTRVMHYQTDGAPPQPMVFDVTDANAPFPLYEMPLRELVRRQGLDTQTSDVPQWFALEPNSSGGLDIRLFPVPDNNRSLLIHFCVPQARLDPTDSTDLGTTIKVPVRPLILGAVWYAMSERGEELGTRLDIARERYTVALTDEIAREESQTGDERYDLVLV